MEAPGRITSATSPRLALVSAATSQINSAVDVTWWRDALFRAARNGGPATEVVAELGLDLALLARRADELNEGPLARELFEAAYNELARYRQPRLAAELSDLRRRLEARESA